MLFLCDRNVAVTKQTNVSHLLEFNYSENRQDKKTTYYVRSKSRVGGYKMSWRKDCNFRLGNQKGLH